MIKEISCDFEINSWEILIALSDVMLTHHRMKTNSQKSVFITKWMNKFASFKIDSKCQNKYVSEVVSTIS